MFNIYIVHGDVEIGAKDSKHLIYREDFDIRDTIRDEHEIDAGNMAVAGMFEPKH
jgi:hypothetical protein